MTTNTHSTRQPKLRAVATPSSPQLRLSGSMAVLARTFLAFAACLPLLVAPGTVSAATRGGSPAWRAATDAGLEAFRKRNAAEAERQFKAALAEAEKLGPKEPKISDSLKALARLYQLTGQLGPAEEFCRRRLAFNEKAQRAGHMEIAHSQLELADVLRLAKKFDEAIELHAKARRSVELKFGKYSPQAAFPKQKLGLIYLSQGKHAEAEAELTSALSLVANPSSDIRFERPDNAAYGMDVYRVTYIPNYEHVAEILDDLALLYRAAKREGDYAATLQKLITTIEKKSKKFTDALPTLYLRLGMFLIEREQFTEAEPNLRKGLAGLDAMDPPANPAFVAVIVGKLADAYENAGKPQDELPLRQRVLAHAEKNSGADSPQTAAALQKLVPIHRRLAQAADLENTCQRLLTIKEKTLGPEHAELTEPLNELAELRLTEGRESEALPLLRRSLAIDSKARGADNLVVGTTLSKLAQIYTKQGNDAELEPILKQQLAVNEATFGAEHVVLAHSLETYAKVLRRLQRGGEAAQHEARAAQIRAKAK